MKVTKLVPRNTPMQNAFIACWREHAKGRSALVPTKWKDILTAWDAAGVPPEVVCALVTLAWDYPIEDNTYYAWYSLCEKVADHMTTTGGWVEL